MKARGSILAVLLAGLSPAACSEKGVEIPAPAGGDQDLPQERNPPPSGETETEPELGPEPVQESEPVFPDVWGTEKLADENPDPHVTEVHLTASTTQITLFDGLTLPMMTYNGQFPGPRLEARKGDTIIVHFTNELEEPTTIHWHGLRIPDSMDGSPRIQDPVPPGGSFEYRFVAPDAGSFWYHPHIRANEQIEKGLYGPIVIRDDNDPEYDRERYLLLDDILIDPRSQTYVPFLASHHELVHGRSGNLLLTNGHASDEVTDEVAQGTVERWRLVNTANARTMRLSVSGATFRVIGTDGGLLRTPYATNDLEIAVGQRFDLEVTYDVAGRAELKTHVFTQNQAGNVVEVGLPVFATNVTPSDVMPREVVWPELPEPPAREIGREVTFELNGVQDSRTGLRWTINGEAHRHEPLFTFEQGDTVKMRIVNLAGPEHPFHLHGQFFEILDPAAPGLRDTVLVPGVTTLEIVAYLDNPGRWMAHCHILEHAELGMMSEIVVLAPVR